MKVEWTESAPRKIQTFAGADRPRENPDLEDLLTDGDAVSYTHLRAHETS